MLVHDVKLIYTTKKISGQIRAGVHSTFSVRSATLQGGTIRTILSKKILYQHTLDYQPLRRYEHFTVLHGCNLQFYSTSVLPQCKK